MDDSRTCLIMDNDTYRQYLETKEAARQQQLAQAKEREIEKAETSGE